jgi:phosphate uptake regulator
MPERAKHISTSFDAALYGLKNDVLMMSSLTDRIFQTAFEALLNRNSELCDHVVAEDEEIDILEKQVTEMLACAHPAFDRTVVLFQNIIEVLYRSMLAVLFQSTL